jgi:phosphatidylinositol alpha-1,6-mannosyltransferase
MANRVIFLTRKFPPSVGGMQTVAASLWSAVFSTQPDARVVALGRGNLHLVWWMPWALTRLFAQLLTRQVRVVLAGDALMNAVARPVVRLFRVPTVVMVHGLDITYTNPLYRRVMIPALRAAPRVLSNSRATAELAIGLGVDPDRIIVIPLAVATVETSPAKRNEMRQTLRAALGVDGDSLVLVTVGRLVERKGVRWFVREVLPRLPETVVYAIAGSGPEAEVIFQTAITAGVSARVRLMGAVTDVERERLLCGADIFIQANIPVEGDIEGFGLVAVEAALRGTPVLASDLEGLRDAVTDGQTGTLLKAADADLWVATVRRLQSDPQALTKLGQRAAEQAAILYTKNALETAVTRALDV